MSKDNKGSFPKCRRDTCFANDRGRCTALEDTHFNGECPFYKERWEKRIEDLRCKARNIVKKEKQEYEMKMYGIK